MLLKKKIEIEAWLNKYQIENYELIENKIYGYIVNVNNNVNLYNKDLKKIEVKFHEVNGYFNCSTNQLTSLKGSPNKIKSYFDCSGNLLTNLKYSPSSVGEYYDCYDNNLISLKGCTKFFNNYLYLDKNDLTLESLKYLPEVEYVDIQDNPKLKDFNQIKDGKELKKNN